LPAPPRNEEYSGETDPLLRAMAQARKTGLEEGRDLSWLDEMEKVVGNNLGEDKPGEDQSQEAETAQP